MPSQLPIPSIADLRQAFHGGVKAIDTRADAHAGSKWDDFAGIGAIVMHRLALHDADLFAACYDGSAEGDDLTYRLETRYGIDRILDASGHGTATLVRPNTAGGAGTFWRGTKILVSDAIGNGAPTYYEVASDTACAANATSMAVPVQSVAKGTGNAVDSSLGGRYIRIDDPLWDTTWTVQRLVCADGTDFEQASDYRARVYQSRLDVRAGYARKIVDACKAAGATNVAAYASNFSGDANDCGLNVVYVGDGGYTTTPSLIRACTLALESVRVLGADLAVRPMTVGSVSVNATIALWDDPYRIDTLDLGNAMRASLVDFFSGASSGFAYSRAQLSGLMTGASNEVQSVAFTTPSSDVGITVGSPAVFPATLTKYRLRPESVLFTFTGPQ